MMKYVFTIMILLSFIAAAAMGKGEALTESVLNAPVEAVELCIYLCGGMCFWGGLMRVAERSGLTDIIAKFFARILGKLFGSLDKNGRAFKAICMNVTANILGLGNAATPLGIEAMQAMKEEENAGDEATPSMVIFTVLNTASLTLIPSTALSLRIKYGSENPTEIIPAVWITSACALAAALTGAVLLGQGQRKKSRDSEKENNKKE